MLQHLLVKLQSGNPAIKMGKRKPRRRNRNNLEQRNNSVEPNNSNRKDSGLNKNSEFEKDNIRKATEPKENIELTNNTKLIKESKPIRGLGLFNGPIAAPSSPASATGSSPTIDKNSFMPNVVTIFQYAYDQTEKAVKIIIDLPGIQNHPKEKISLKATEFSFNFFVEDLDGKNWSLGVPQLAHEILEAEVKYIQKKDKVVLILPKKRHSTWMSLTPKADTLKKEWIATISSIFYDINLEVAEPFETFLERLWIQCEALANNINLFDQVVVTDLFEVFIKSDTPWKTLEDVLTFAKKQILETIAEDGVFTPFLLGTALLEYLIEINRKKDVPNKGKFEKDTIVSNKSAKTIKPIQINEGMDELRPALNSEEIGDSTTFHKPLKSNEPNYVNQGMDDLKPVLNTEEMAVPLKTDEVKSTSKLCETINLKSDKNCGETILTFTPIDISFKIRERNLNNTCKNGLSERLAACLEYLANDHFKLMNYPAAIAKLDELIELLPDQSYAYSNRAFCYLKLKRFKESLKDGHTAILLDKTNFDGWICFGESHLAFGTPLECLDELEKILNDTDCKSLDELEKILNDTDCKSLDEFEKILIDTDSKSLDELEKILNDTDTKSLDELEKIVPETDTKSLDELKKIVPETDTKSLDELKKIVPETDSESVKNIIFKLRKLSWVLKEAQNRYEADAFESSFTYYEAASKIAIESLSVKQKLMECLVLSGKPSEAMRLVEIVPKEKDSHPDSYFIKGMIQYYQGKKDDAFENLDKCLSIDQGHERCKKFYRKARDLYFMKERGNEYYKKKKYKLAIRTYTNALTIDSKNKVVNSTIYFNIGVTHLQLEKVADALQFINTAVNLNNQYVKALLKRAEIYLEVQQIQDAVNDLQAVCKISPSPSNKKLLEEAKTRLKSAPKPQKNFTSLKEEEQNKILAESKKEKGNNFFENRQYEKAIKLYSEAIFLDPNCPIHYSNRSACQMMLKKYQEAMIDALKSLELDSSFVKGYLRKGRIELALGKGKEALRTFIQGLKLDSKDLGLKEGKVNATKLLKSISKGDAYFEKNHFEEAARCYGEAANIACSCSEVMVKKIESLLFCSKHFEVRRLLEGQTEDANYYYVCGLLDHFNCDKEKALSNASKALKMDANHTKAKALKKIVHDVNLNWENGIKAKKRRKLSTALKFLEIALNIDPLNKTLQANVLCDLGDCFVLQEDFEKAVQQFTVAIESKGDMVRPYLERAKCYDRLGRLEESVKDFEQAYRLLPVPINKKLLDDAKLKLKKSKKKDYYKVLGLNSKASMDDIRKSYKKLAKEHHPDRHMTDSDKEKGEIKFKEINEAYSILSDSQKRERYDRDDIEDYSSLFENFFFRPNPFGFNRFHPFFWGFPG